MKKEEGFEKIVDQSLRTLVKASIIVFLAILLSKIFAYLYKVIIARHFGPEVYGLFSLLAVISGWMIAVSSLGLSDGLLRYIPLFRGKKEYAKINYLFKLTVKIILVSSIFFSILLYFSSNYISITFFHNESLAFFLKVFSFFLPVTVLAYLLVSVIRGYEKITAFVLIYQIIPNLTRLLFLIFFVYLGLTQEAIVFSFCLGLFIMFLAAFLVCKYKIPELFIKTSTSKKEQGILRKEIISYSLPILFFGIIYSIFYWIDSISLGYLKSATEVGIYNAAVPIAMLLGITAELFIQLFFPLITREYSKSNFKLITDLGKNVSKWIFMINLPLFILMFFFPGVIIKILFGASYLAAETSLRILLIGSLISSITVVSNNLLYMAGKSKTILLDMLLASAINLVLNFILIPKEFILGINNSNGLVGAAIATLIAVIILNTLFIIQAKNATKIFPFKRRMIRIFFLLVIPFLLLFYMQSKINVNILSALFLTVGFLLLYLLLLILFKGLDEKDIMIIKTIFNKLNFLKRSK